MSSSHYVIKYQEEWFCFRDRDARDRFIHGCLLTRYPAQEFRMVAGMCRVCDGYMRMPSGKRHVPKQKEVLF